MKSSRQDLGICIALAAFVGLLAWLLPARQHDDATPAAHRAMADDERRAGTPSPAPIRNRTEAESRTGATPPSAVRPPGFSPAATASTPVGRPLPDGYQHTAFVRRMRTRAMAPAGYAADPEVEGAPAWLRDGGGVEALVSQAGSERRGWTYGWVAVAPDADRNAVSAAVRGAGGELLGPPGTAARARLPAQRERLEEIAGLAGVDGLGTPPARLKLPPAFAAAARSAPAHETAPVFVALMDDDPDGRWRRALSGLGAVVGRYDPELRVYLANVPHGAVEAVAAADFVMAVEPVGFAHAAHDTAVPAMGADAARSFDAAAGAFTGTAGATVPVGVMDTGLNVSHLDIGGGRGSICGANFTPLFHAGGQDLDLWTDAGYHGTHVTGTILGSGAGDRRYAGMAPGVRDIRFAKVLTDAGFGDLDGVLRGMDFLARPTACGGGEPLKALLVNASLGDDGIDWRGRTTAERKLDAAVWSHRQLYVVANSNAGFQALGDFAAAKNSLSVGAVHDGGDIAAFSSHGPTADGRLAPLVVGTGVEVRSARGDGRRSGYVVADGTSMASPAVAGVAALLMDAVPAFREQPAAVRARLMASAIRPDAFLDDAQRFPAHNGDGPGELQHRYGLGKVSARAAFLARDLPDGWTSGATVVEPGDGEYAFHDIEVPAGASRLDIAMTWDERPADTLVQAVLNDLDLWADHDADCPPSAPAACGEAASRSTRDNVEWLVLRDPPPGAWRLKVVPKRAHVDTPRVGLAWTVIRGPSTPRLKVAAGPGVVAAAPGEPFEVAVSVSVDGYVAAGATLRIDCRAAHPAVCSRIRLLAPKASGATREDAVARSLEHDADSAIALGEVAAGEEQQVDLVFLGTDEPGRFRLHFTVTSWNGKGASTSVEVAVGAPDTPPPPPAAVPPNDDYAEAERLTGDAGSRTLDLLLATPEPGEPPALAGPGAPTERPRSVWYAWTAPDTDTFRFSVDAGGPLGVADELGMDLFETAAGEPLAGLRTTELKVGGGLTFAALRGQDYRLRVGLVDASFEVDPAAAAAAARRVVEPLTLRWSRAALPANDAFGQAVRIGGSLGATEGSNLGASVEAGEHAGPLAATTWFRWTAPSTGNYAFSVDRRGLAVAAFTGDDVAALRLVSGVPGSAVVFPALAGDEYRIVVAARGAYASGNDYTLRWAPGLRDTVPNDDLAGAETIPADAPFHVLAADFAAATVQPREPGETGVRTAWWRWTAPADGVWTWRAQRFQGAFRMNVFRIEQAAEFVRLAGTDPDAARLEFSWEAAAGTPYFLSVGVPPDAPFARLREDRLMLQWGPSPANDHLGAAAVLTGPAGSVSGSNAFATVERGEDAGGVGHSSLWWSWEAPTEGWYRFSLAQTQAGVLAVYRRGPDGALERLAVGRRLSGTADAVFRAEAGATYVVRLGTRPPWPGEGFELSWEEHGVPAWLRFAGVLEDGDLDAAGTLVQVAEPRAMAFHPDGHALYAATADGLQAYARDAGSGALRLEQTIGGVDNDALLLWDAATRSLLAGSCLGWDRFAPAGDGAGLAHAGAIAPPTPCPEASAFTDATGALLLLVRPGVGLETYRLDADRTAIEYLGATGVAGIGAATASGSGGFVYAAADDALHTFALDPASGALEPLGAVRDGADAGGGPVEGLSGVRALAVDAADTTLFAFGSGGAGTATFDLAEPERPRFVDALQPFTASAALSVSNIGFSEPEVFLQSCGQPRVRPGRLAVDVFCETSAFTVQLRPGGALRAEDDLFVDGVDRFGGDVPDFRVTGGVAASPDGRHLYAGLERGFLILERAPSP